MQIIITKDGSHSVMSEKFGVTYHSIHGAIQETRHVFIEAGMKYQLENGYEALSFLEIGFGTGLNAYMTLLEAEEQKVHIQFTTTEAYPISAEQARSLNYPQELGIDNPSSFFEMHDGNWEENYSIGDYFQLTKHEMLFEDIDFKDAFDVIYFDAFAPNAQSQFWEEDFLSQMYDALRESGVLVTYCAKGSFKRALKAVGFTVEAISGPPGKREMTRATKLT